jgi:hypothetical protein
MCVCVLYVCVLLYIVCIVIYCVYHCFILYHYHRSYSLNCHFILYFHFHVQFKVALI